MKRSIWLILLLFVLVAAVSAQRARVPKFSQYPAAVERVRARGVDFRHSKGAATYRTRLNEGFGRGVNFAGHYIIVGWGCGTGCTNAAVIDGRTGKVIWPEEFYNVDASYGEGYSDVQLDFRKNSRLLIIHGRPGSAKESGPTAPMGDHYFEWRNNHFRLLKVVKKA